MFLQHVVEKALAGEFDSLKERILGIDLFGRDSLFDTDRDSVVRVAANDVRRRLKEFYRDKPRDGVQISLPTGLYIPKIEVVPAEPFSAGAGAPESPIKPDRDGKRKYILVLLAMTAGLALLSIWLGFRISSEVVAPPPSIKLLPWSAMLKSGRPISVVTADANLVVAKVRSGKDVPIETYVGHGFVYAPDIPGPLGSYLNDIPLTTVSDAVLGVRIAELTSRAGGAARIRYSRRLDISEFKGEDPVVLLGSPMSNPWTNLFYDQLNFRVVHRFDSGYDVCENRQPKPGELQVYVPNLRPAAISEGYALIALTPNLAGAAPVLIIAGTSTEATEGAGEFVTDLDRLSASLKKLGIDQRPAAKRMELLIRTSFVSASSAQSEVIAYRIQ